MTSALRALLGTRHRYHLAVEEIENAPEGAASNEDTTVVMKGPLADVYSEALGKMLDKNAPPEGNTEGASSEEGQPNDGQGAPADPTAAAVDTTNLTPAAAPEQTTVETAVASEVGTIVLESQAIDAAVAQSLAAAIADEAPADSDNYETLYAVDQTQVSPTDVKDVTAILAEADKPESVTVLIDNVVPESAIEEGQAAEVAAAKELAVTLESVVIGLGGKVVHSFKDYFEARRTK